MTTVSPSQLGADDLARLYEARFSDLDEYRKRVWAALVDGFFQKLVPEAGAVLDIGCGWGGFINNIRAARRLGIDLNPSARQHLHPGVEFLEQSCSEPWPVADGTLDTVFTSNFLEHLPDKTQVKATLAQAFRTLKPGGADLHGAEHPLRRWRLLGFFRPPRTTHGAFPEGVPRERRLHRNPLRAQVPPVHDGQRASYASGTRTTLPSGAAPLAGDGQAVLVARREANAP